MAGLYVSLVALLIISVTQFIETIEQNAQQRFVVYNVAGTSVYDMVQCTKNYFYAPTTLINDKDKMLFNVEHNWWKSGLEKQKFIQLDSIYPSKGILQFIAGNKNILAIDNHFNAETIYTKKVKTDFVILRENTEIEVQQVMDYFDPGLIIFDSSNSTKMCRKWETACKKSGVKFYDVAKQGAFITEL